MAREIKDEQQINQNPMNEPERILSPIQIQVTPEMERTLVDIVSEDYHSSKDARQKRQYGTDSKGGNLDFDKWIKSIRELYYGKRESKDIPWKFCSNRSLRIATSILDMLHARLFPAVVNEDMLKFRPGDITDVPKVDRITKLMKWWVFVHSRLRGFFDNWIKVVLGYGDCLTETSWKVELEDTGVTESIPVMDEQGLPMINQDGTPAVSTSRVINPIESSISKIYMRDQFYLQEGSRDIKTEPVILEDTVLFRELEDGEARGAFVNITTDLKEKIPYGKETKSGITPEEELRVRDIKIRNHPVKIHKWYGNFDSDGDGFAERIRIITAPDYDIYLGGTRLTDIAFKGKQTLDFTKIDSRIDAPEENSGEGVLEKVRELAEEIDAIFNQMTDGNTLTVMRPGFYDPAGDVDAPVLKLAPNKITPVSDPSHNIFFPDMMVKTDQLILAIRLVLEFIERLTAASSYVLGKESEIVGGSGTATRTNAIVSAAEQRFALPAERLREGASRIINHHLSLLQLNIPPGLETRVLGEDMKPLFEQSELTMEGISGEYDAYLLPDPSMGSKETERELASMFYSILMQNIIVGTDPVKIYKITADFLKAYGKEPEAYLGPEPDSDMIDSPEDENTLMLQGDFERVKAQIAENHILHIQKHMEFDQSPSLAMLPPHLLMQVRQFNQQHIMEHQMMMQAMLSLVQKLGGSGGEGGIGNQSAENSESQGASNARGMEHTSGPLAGALETKRIGEGGSYTPSQGL